MTDNIQEKAAQLSQSEIMDKLASMQEEMFMAGHNAALKSILPSIQGSLRQLTRIATNVEDYLKENDPTYEEDMKALQEKNQEQVATQLSQFTNRVVANMENVKNN